MTFKASRRSAVIAAAGLWIGLGGLAALGFDSAQAAPASPAAASDKQPAAKPAAKKPVKHAVAKTKPAAKHTDTAAAKSSESKSSESKAARAAETKPADSQTAETKPAAKIAVPRSGSPEPAAFNSADATAPDTKLMADGATPKGDAALPASVANANAQMPSGAPVAGVQLADAAAGDAAVVAPDQVNDVDLAAAPDQPQPTVGKSSANVVASFAAPDDSIWSQTSLIGKIFMAFGGLLTLASAARMFFA